MYGAGKGRQAGPRQRRNGIDRDGDLERGLQGEGQSSRRPGLELVGADHEVVSRTANRVEDDGKRQLSTAVDESEIAARAGVEEDEDNGAAADDVGAEPHVVSRRELIPHSVAAHAGKAVLFMELVIGRDGRLCDGQGLGERERRDGGGSVEIIIGRCGQG